MTEDEVKKLAAAIAKANGHPEPDAWAQLVTDHYTGKTEALAETPTTDPTA